MVRFTRSTSTILFLLAGFITGCSGGGASPSTPSVATQALLTQGRYGQSPELVYVSNETANSITAYATSSSGNARPVLTIAGSKTKLDQPSGLAFDSSGKLYVVNHGLHQSSITIYSQGSSGNVPPIGTIEGPKTHLRAELDPPDYPTGAIAVDSTNGHIFVGRVSDEQSPLPNNVLVFKLSARGNAVPIASIGASNSRRSNSTTNPWYEVEPAPAVVFDGAGLVPRIIAGTELNDCCHGSDGWTYYDASRLAANGSFHYYANEGLNGLAVAPDSGNVIASYSSVIDVWPAGITGISEGPGGFVGGPFINRPLRVLFGPTGFGAVAVDSKDRIWAIVSGPRTIRFPSSIGAAQIDVYGPSATTPIVISGPSTGLSGPSGIAVFR